MEIYDVVRKLIGEIDPVGASHIDDKRLENLKIHMDLVYQLLADLEYVARQKDKVEYSINIMGKKAHMFLKELSEEFNLLNKEK